MVDGIMSPVKDKNCEDDMDSFLVDAVQLFSENKNCVLQPQTEQDSVLQLSLGVQNITIIVADYSCPMPDLQELNVIAYIGGYIVNKIEKVICKDCAAKLQMNKPTCGNPATTFTQQKQYSSCKHGLIYPCDSLVDFLTKLELVNRQKIDELVTGTSVMHNLEISCTEEDMQNLDLS